MKQKLYLLIAAFLLFSLMAMSQSPEGKEVKPYFGQTGVKKKISELLAFKSLARKPLDTSNIKPLKVRLNKFSNFTKPDRETRVLGVPYDGEEHGEDEVDAKRALRPSSAMSAASTQQVWSNFLSHDFYDNRIGWPPDPSGDVGASQIIVSSNLGIKVHNKSSVTDLPVVTDKGYSREEGPSSLFVPLDKFFSPVLPDTSGISDPHIRYDRLTKRWFVVAIEVNSSFENNLIFLAVSDGDKVTDSSSFTYYSFNSSLFPYDHDAPYAPFLDYPTLGIDKNSVVIGGNQFGYDSLTNVGYVIDKEKLIHGKLIVYPFELGVGTNDTASGMYTPQGVQNDDPNGKKSFFAGISWYQDGIFIATIEYDKKKKPFLASEIAVPVEPFTYGRDNASPGGLTPIDQLDTRLFAAAIYKNKLTGTSSLWTSHAIGVDQSGKSASMVFSSDSDYTRKARTASRWYKIGNVYTKPRMFQSGTIYDDKQPSGRRAVQYFNPSIAASGQGHSIVSGTTDAYNEYLNVFGAGRYFGDELGISKAPVKATNTTAIYSPYVIDRGSHFYVGRWGDYSQTVTDPSDDQTIWTFQEYADVDDSYGIRVVQFKAPPPAAPAAIGNISNKTDTTIILEGESIDHSGFFDPGKDAGGPGYNRLSVKSTGNIIVSNIKFISTTKISFTLNTKNKPAGQYILIITNPDGQLAVTDFTITANTTTLIAGINSLEQKAMRDKVAQDYITKVVAFPNPTTDNVTLQINAAKEHIAKIILVGVNGKQVFERNYSFSKGNNLALLPIEKFVRGTYIAAVYNSDNVLIATQKIVKQ